MNDLLNSRGMLNMQGKLLKLAQPSIVKLTASLKWTIHLLHFFKLMQQGGFEHVSTRARGVGVKI